MPTDRPGFDNRQLVTGKADNREDPADFVHDLRSDRDALRAAVLNKYSRDPNKLRGWKSASHTKRAPKKTKAPDEPLTPPAP